MNKAAKIALIVLAILIVVCIISCVVGVVAFGFLGKTVGENMVVSEPAQIVTKAKQIVQYDLPEGYQEKELINFFFGQMLMIEPVSMGGEVSQKPVIIFTQIAKLDESMDRDEMRLKIQESMKQSMNEGDYHLVLKGQREVTINQQKVKVFEYEGSDENGVKVQQMVSDFFPATSGSVLFYITGVSTGWDQAEIDAFIQSIH